MTKRLTPIKAIRKFCLECAGTSKEVDLCTANREDIKIAAENDDEIPYSYCPLYPYRKGHRPPKGDNGPAEINKSKIEAQMPTSEAFGHRKSEG